MKKLRTIINSIFRIGVIKSLMIFLVLINVFALSLFVIDKRKAEKNKRRFSEKLLIFFTLSFGGIGALLGMCLAHHKTTRRKFKIAVVIGVIITLIPVIHIAHSLTYDRLIRYVEIEFRSDKWPVELNGYRIAFMTDMHTISDNDMKNVATVLNERQLDLLLLGGDFSMGNSHYLGTLKEISKINTVDGIFGVEGNHDDYVRLFKAKEEYGITPLDNSGTLIKEGFYLAGVQDMWNRNPNIKAAVSNANLNDFILLISHNPDLTMVQSTKGIDLVLSGHTHGGQITLFGYPFYLHRGSITSYGTRFANGFSNSLDGTPVYTSNGVGEYYTIPRIFSRPEVIIFTLNNE